MDQRKLILGGDSAGAILSLSLATLCRDGLDANLLPSPKIKIDHIVAIYPALFNIKIQGGAIHHDTKRMYFISLVREILRGVLGWTFCTCLMC